MVNEDDDAEVSDDAVEELLDAEPDDEELELDAKDTVDEFGGGDDEVKSRDWE